MLVTLDEAKLYLKVDGDTDDSLITSCINSAEELCEDILRFPLAEFVEIPETVKQAALYAIGNLYEQRETVDMQSMIDLMKRLLFAYRKEGW
ncbi:head-tail connector protein [Dehalobacter sp. DCM]|uniref:head-tail connector protein n=1 Tax=Dehalobacter sp. DCM TaxID=2907827 RepID=UPI003081880C|nr:head-tail connector protein [Dehalobacter sp. DCM]